MSFIRTVLGDIAPEELGVCYSHEHLIIDPSFATDQNPDFLLDSVENGVAEVRELKAMGVGACVDSMPMDCGRNLTKLAEISRQSGVHILAPTGLHLAKYYSPEHWSAGLSPIDERWLADLFVADIEEGARMNDSNSPSSPRGVYRAGLIKVAALEEWDARTQGIFLGAMWAQEETGAPILTHTENGRLALEQARFLEEQGADLEHVVLSHLDRNPDVAYHRAVLQTGVTIEYDSHFRWKGDGPNPTLELLKVLLPEFPNQIVLGMDAARRSYWKSYGGKPGLSYLYGNFRNQMLEAGISQELVGKVFVSTPTRVYSFSSAHR